MAPEEDFTTTLMRVFAPMLQGQEECKLAQLEERNRMDDRMDAMERKHEAEMVEMKNQFNTFETNSLKLFSSLQTAIQTTQVTFEKNQAVYVRAIEHLLKQREKHDAIQLQPPEPTEIRAQPAQQSLPPQPKKVGKRRKPPHSSSNTNSREIKISLPVVLRGHQRVHDSFSYAILKALEIKRTKRKGCDKWNVQAYLCQDVPQEASCQELREMLKDPSKRCGRGVKHLSGLLGHRQSGNGNLIFCQAFDLCFFLGYKKWQLFVRGYRGNPFGKDGRFVSIDVLRNAFDVVIE